MALYRIARGYRWQHQIPLAVRNRAALPTALQKSLTTRHSQLAKSLAEYLSQAAPLLFGLIEGHPELTSREVRTLVRNLYHLADTVDIRHGAPERARFLEDDIRAALGVNDKRGSPTYSALSAFRRHLHALLKEFDARLGSKGSSSAHAKLLSQVILLYLDECRTSFTSPTYFNRQTFLGGLLKIIGDKPIHDVTRQDLRDFKETLFKLPTFWERRFPAVPIPELVSKAENYRKLSVSTVNNYLSVAGTFFEWALMNGYVGNNLARRLKVRVKQIPSMERDRFSDEDLRAIFQRSALYSKNDNATSINVRKRDVTTYHYFWVPLISVFSGLRAGEILGLERRDIICLGRVWCFQVRPNGLRKLKSAGAERRIPIHPLLVRLGFIRALHSARLTPASPLWPNHADPARSRLGTAFSHYWSKYRRTAGIDQPRKTFHSFRHTFLDKLANLERRAEIVSDISGHTIKNQVFGRYRKRASPARLLKAIERVRYKVSFRHLIDLAMPREPRRSD